tara:strand:- start:962 stop:1156 length:195 start_codon:yes stop_codon:yes gene_type:complete
MTLIEHLGKEITLLKEQIFYGKQSNKNNLDGYTLRGLEKKLKTLETCLYKLTEDQHIYSKNKYE